MEKESQDLNCVLVLFLGRFLSYRFGNTETNETEWKELPGCQNVTRMECDFSSAITEYYDTHHVRIRAEGREEVSPWSSIFEIIPYFIGMSSIYTATFIIECPSAYYCGKNVCGFHCSQQHDLVVFSTLM